MNSSDSKRNATPAVDTSEQKRARLAELLRNKVRPTQAPASFSQERMWFQDRLSPGSAAFNIPVRVRFSGALDVAVLRASLQELVRRHAPLRTTFAEQDGRPLQRIAPVMDVPLPVVDLRSLPEGEREAEAQRRLTDEARQPFDLEKGPLLRTVLYRLDALEHVLLLELHHIITDGWSMGVLVRELGALYPALALGLASPLAPLPMQYADYAAWQREHLKGEVLDSHVRWWRERLDPDAVLELPTDRPRPAVLSGRGARLTEVLPLALLESLKVLARAEGTTLFGVLLAGVGGLLHRYTGQQDVVVGTSVAGRGRAELEGLMGLFTNYLALRTDVSGQPTFRALLGRVRETTLEAYAHQDVPFEKLVDALKPERQLSVNPLFQVALTLQNAPLPPLQLPGLVLDAQPVDNRTSKTDLSLLVTEVPQGLRVTAEYSTDLFEPASIQRLLSHLRTLLEGAVSAPDQRISALPLMEEEEQRRVQRDWTGTSAPFPEETCLHGLFEAQARRTPEAPAVRFRGRSLTYAQLDARANQLAHALRRRGVGPEVRVALGVERSLDVAVGLLGILKAGGAWVPVDPLLPVERLAFMLEDSTAAVLVTHAALLERFPEAHRARALCLDAEADALARESTEALDTGVGPRNLAYLLYTSGSTGTPKGTSIEHRGLSNLVTQEAPAYGIGPGSRVLQFASLSFDLSVEEIFTTLCSGATLVLALLEELMPGEPLRTLLRDEALTVISLTPATLAATPAEGLPALRTVISGGEALSPEVVTRWAPGRTLLNTYGPTEATVMATLTGCVADGRVPSIGRPLANVRAYVLDAHGEPVPVGIKGELYLGGVGVARGYAGRPALTAEKFIPDAFSGQPGARLYRTGDVVRWREDGTLEFIGRADAQVKVRGFRIELGEVEAALTKLPAVREAVVVAREDGPGGKRLVGYAVPREGLDTDGASLRSALKSVLPEYMVPSAVVVLAALPLTANGKVDRKALPAPDVTAGSSREYVAPRTPTEERLAAQWRELLGAPRVGAHDHFFDLGGHSLLATQALSRIRQAFSVELSLRRLFESPSLDAVARIIDEALTGLEDAARGRGARPPPPPLVPVPRTGALPLSFAQQRLWFIDQLAPGAATYNMPTFVRLEGTLDVEALRHGFAELVQRHESLRTTFRQEQGEPLQHIAPDAELPLELMDLSDLAADVARTTLEQQLRDEARWSFDLATGPLVRARLWRLRTTEHVLALTMHHIVSDGWSMGVLVRELAALYEALTQGRPSPLPPLPLQYADHAVWQRRWLRDEVLDSQLDFWRQQLSGLAALELPTDKPRPPVQTFRGAHVPVGLPPPLSQGLKALCQREGATPFMALLAAWQVLLARYSGQRDVAVGSPIAGRQQGEVEGIIGFFVNTLVLRAQVDGQRSFLQLLRQVKETALGAYAHQDVPFERLVEELRPARDLSRSPLFQVVFVLQNTPLPSLRLRGLTLQPLGEEGSTARFDLELNLAERSEGYSGRLTYNTDLFEPGTAARIAEHFRTLLEGLVARPEAALSSVPLLTQAERQRVLVEWNATVSEYPRTSTLPDVFAQVVALFPDKVAVEFSDARLTYRELDARANALAWHLRGLGVGTDSRVALAVERSLELLVCLVAILKAGAAYVPLDPAYPPQRLAAMVEDSGPSVVLTTRALLSKLPREGLLPVVLEDVSLESLPTHAPPAAALPDSLAYIDFTSGSTGRPKGVGIPHSAVLRTLFSVDYAHFGPDETLLLMAPLSFDATTLELWGALLHGAKLAVFPPHPPSDPHELERVLARHGVTTLFLTSGLFSQVVDHALPALRGVRQVLTGGDVVSAPHVRRVLERLFIPVTACYGPTEVTVLATGHRMTRVEQVGVSVPIGRPIGNTQVYVLDASGQPVPLGVTGELHVGGAGLARGYVGQPALTAERFVPDAFSRIPGARLYRTGDLVRWRGDGVLEFLGRIDAQVKVRGFRIELAELEAALLAHPDVAEAVAVVREDVPGDKRLVAYVVTPEPFDAAALRAHLKARLPEYMLPSAVVRLDALPLTPNAKVDRKALPRPESVASSAAAAFVAPRSPLEETLARCFTEVLRVPRVGVTDSFFDLGGHSLLALRLVAAIRASTGHPLPMTALFQHATVEQLARLLARQDASRPTSNLVRLDAGTSSRRPLFLIHGGGGSVLGYSELVRQLGSDRPVYGLHASGLEGGALPPASVEALARDYLAQVRTVQPHGPYLLGGWSFGGLVALEMARQLQGAGEPVELLALMDSSVPTLQPRPAPDRLSLLGLFARTLGLPWQALSLDLERLRHLEGRALWAHVLEAARSSSAGDLGLDVDGAEHLFALFQCLSEAQRTYVPASGYTGPALVFRATHPGQPTPEAPAWGTWLTGPLTEYPVPGDHYAMLSAPHAATVAERFLHHLRALERDAA